MEETQITFGTDGWRGMIAEDFTFANVRRCAQGFASYLLETADSGARVVVGYDKRFGSDLFAAAVAEVLVANGFRVLLTDGATPTPVISYSVVHHHAAGAVNITASHNPPADNGFKVRDSHGGAIPPDGLKRIEALIPPYAAVKRTPLKQAVAAGQAALFDAAPAYLGHIAPLVDVEPIRQAGLNILCDPMWGNGAGWFPRILGGGRTKVTEIHAERNPSFPEMKRPEPIPPNIDAGLRRTVEMRADVLLITDGDADRMGIGDERGRFLNQLQVYALLALYMLEVRGERRPIVKTLSTTSMLNALGKLYDVPVHETGVGFKYVAPKFMETGAMLGGEESGGYAFRGNVPERDGILGNLYFLDFMVKTGKTPSQLLDYLFEKVGPHYYDRVDTTFPNERREEIRQRLLNARPQTIGGLPFVSLDTTDGFKFNLGDGSWMLVRFSGTEPIIRVYTETKSQDRVQPVLEDGLKIAGLR